MTPDYCPNCGEAVPPKAKACPACGACEKTGWSDEAHADALGLPGEDFDYDDFVKREFEGQTPKRKHGWLFGIVAVLLLLAFALALLR